MLLPFNRSVTHEPGLMVQAIKINVDFQRSNEDDFSISRREMSMLCKAPPVFYSDLPCLYSALKAGRSLDVQVVVGDAQLRFPSQVCPLGRCWHLGAAGGGRIFLVLNSLLLIPGIHSPQPHSSKPPSSSSSLCPEGGCLIPKVFQLHTWMLDFVTVAFVCCIRITKMQ